MHQGWAAGQAVEATWPPNLPPKKVDFGDFEPEKSVDQISTLKYHFYGI